MRKGEPGYDEYKQRLRLYMNDRYHRIRSEMIHDLGGKCVKCNTECDLEIDHIDPSKKTMKVSDMCSVSKSRRVLELMNCQLLCRHCHVEKTVVEDRQCEFFGIGFTPQLSCQSCSKVVDTTVWKFKNGAKFCSRSCYLTFVANKPIKHGMTMYVKGCRCDVCKSANSARMKKYNNAKKARP